MNLTDYLLIFLILFEFFKYFKLKDHSQRLREILSWCLGITERINTVEDTMNSIQYSIEVGPPGKPIITEKKRKVVMNSDSQEVEEKLHKNGVLN